MTIPIELQSVSNARCPTAARRGRRGPTHRRLIGWWCDRRRLPCSSDSRTRRTPALGASGWGGHGDRSPGSSRAEGVRQRHRSRHEASRTPEVALPRVGDDAGLRRGHVVRPTSVALQRLCPAVAPARPEPRGSGDDTDHTAKRLERSMSRCRASGTTRAYSSTPRFSVVRPTSVAVVVRFEGTKHPCAWRFGLGRARRSWARWARIHSQRDKGPPRDASASTRLVTWGSSTSGGA